MGKMDSICHKRTLCIQHPEQNLHIKMKLEEFIREDTLLDVHFVCAEKQIVHAHKLVLSAFSKRMTKLFKEVPEWMQDNMTIHVPDVDASALQLLIDSLYTSQMKLTRQQLNKVLIVQDFLGINIPTVSDEIDLAVRQEPKNPDVIDLTILDEIKSEPCFNDSINSSSPNQPVTIPPLEELAVQNLQNHSSNQPDVRQTHSPPHRMTGQPVISSLFPTVSNHQIPVSVADHPNLPIACRREVSFQNSYNKTNQFPKPPCPSQESPNQFTSVVPQEHYDHSYNIPVTLAKIPTEQGPKRNDASIQIPAGFTELPCTVVAKFSETADDNVSHVILQTHPQQSQGTAQELQAKMIRPQPLPRTKFQTKSTHMVANCTEDVQGKISQALSQPVMSNAVSPTLGDRINDEISTTLTAFDGKLKELEDIRDNYKSATLTHQLKSSQENEKFQGNVNVPSTISSYGFGGFAQEEMTCTERTVSHNYISLELLKKEEMECPEVTGRNDNISSQGIQKEEMAHPGRNYNISPQGIKQGEMAYPCRSEYISSQAIKEEEMAYGRSDNISSQAIKEEEMAYGRSDNISFQGIKKEEMACTERNNAEGNISFQNIKQEETANTNRSDSVDNFSSQGIKKEEIKSSVSETTPCSVVKTEQSIINELVPFEQTDKNETHYETTLKFAQVKLTRLSLPDKVLRKENVSSKEGIPMKEKTKRKQKRCVDEENDAGEETPCIPVKKAKKNNVIRKKKEIKKNVGRPSKHVKKNQLKNCWNKDNFVLKTKKPQVLLDNTKPCALSEEISSVVGENIMTRKGVLRRIWMYAKHNGLVLTNEHLRKRCTKCDQQLFKIFEKKFISYQSMRIFLYTMNRHITELK